MRSLGVFSRADLEVIYPDLDPRRLYEWQLKGYILKLRNSWYCLPGFLNEPYSTWMIANAVHAPSYISLESALSYYGLIPEGVYLCTSVCTSRTLRITMAGHDYEYSQLGKKLYTGYRLEETGTGMRRVRIAEPEKALLDFMYLRSAIRSRKEISDLRFNTTLLDELVDRDRLYSYLDLYTNQALTKRVELILKPGRHA